MATWSKTTKNGVTASARARNEVPRAGHAVFKPLSTRPDPVRLLERQAKTRVPELVPIRYGRMLVSPSGALGCACRW